MNHIVKVIIILLTIYAIIPTLLIRIFGFGVFRKGKNSPGIALTFDDGPDLEFTPRLLDLLARYKIRATFFVLGSKAERLPEIIQRMHNEGHLIGVHNYMHWSNAIMSPWKVRKQLDHSVHIIEQIIGKRPVYYRPPWGVINLFDFLLLKRFRMVLWSIIVGDWNSRGGKDKIGQRLLSQLRDGAVILLHDSGQTLGADQDAPRHMLEALEEFLEQTSLQGYSFVTIDEKIRVEVRNGQKALSWQKRLLVAVWLKWEHLFHILFKVKPIDPENLILQSRLCTYRGKTIVLEDGEQLRKGDRVVELHLNNEMLFKMAREARSMVQLAVQMKRAVQVLMPKIEEWIFKNPNYGEIKGVYGITMVYRGTRQLGFTVADLSKGMFYFFTRLYLHLLLSIIHPMGRKRLEVKGDLLTPKVVAISVKELRRIYRPEQEQEITAPAQTVPSFSGYEERVCQ